MKDVRRIVETFVNEEKGVVHTKVTLRSTLFNIPEVVASGSSRCHEGDVFDVEFGKKLATARALKTAHKLYLQQLRKLWVSIQRLEDQVEDLYDVASDKISNYEANIKHLVDSKRVED